MVCAIYKKGDMSSVSNYRPISLLSCLEKVAERAVFKHLYNHLHENSILTPLQSGFIPGDSPTNQLTYLYDTFSHALDSGKEIRVVFCDISKAFDRVWHQGILLKLQAAGVTGNLLSWFRSYLSNRRQKVVLPGASSTWNFIFAGVPQGSILVLHTRLCTKCSALNYEIYLKNLTDTPLCCCGNIENSEHFFLQCRYYHRQRLEMIQTISPLCHITLDVLLFGDSSLSMNTNTSIFTAVQKFIVETKRF